MSTEALIHGRAVVDAVHADLLSWGRRALDAAGFGDIALEDGFGGSPQRPRIIVYPYRLGPDKMVDHNDAGRQFLVTEERSPPEGAGVPEVWRTLGHRVAEALEDVLPTHKLGGRTLTMRRPPLASLPGPMMAWYAQTDPKLGWFDAEAATAWTPTLWWNASFPLDLNYLLAGVYADDRPAGGPLMLSAMATLRAAVHVDGVLAVSLPPVPAPEPLWGFVEAVAESVPYGDEIREAAQAARDPFTTRLSVVPIHSVDDRDIFTLMRSIGRPLHATLGLKVRIGIGQRVGFEPGGDTRTTTKRRSSR